MVNILMAKSHFQSDLVNMHFLIVGCNLTVDFV